MRPSASEQPTLFHASQFVHAGSGDEGMADVERARIPSRASTTVTPTSTAATPYGTPSSADHKRGHVTPPERSESTRVSRKRARSPDEFESPGNGAGEDTTSVPTSTCGSQRTTAGPTRERKPPHKSDQGTAATSALPIPVSNDPRVSSSSPSVLHHTLLAPSPIAAPASSPTITGDAWISQPTTHLPASTPHLASCYTVSQATMSLTDETETETSLLTWTPRQPMMDLNGIAPVTGGSHPPLVLSRQCDRVEPMMGVTDGHHVVPDSESLPSSPATSVLTATDVFQLMGKKKFRNTTERKAVWSDRVRTLKVPPTRAHTRMQNTWRRTRFMILILFLSIPCVPPPLCCRV
jgi:hypothetical protein